MPYPWRTPVPDVNWGPAAWPDVMILAATVLGEAEGEPLDGKLGVAWVIQNRVSDKRWPDNVAGVCMQRLQFSCWNMGSPRLPVIYHVQDYVKEAVWNACFVVATQALFNLAPDPTLSSNHYHEQSIHPSWATGDPTVKIGRHWFYKL